MDALQATYRRGQVEQAIARIHRVANFDGQAPQELRSDLKRLLDIDRKPRSEKLKGNTDLNAFYDESDGPKKGWEVSYRTFHAFALLIAYRLAETGMTQSRVVGFMREIRNDLESTFDQLIMDGAAVLQKKLSEDELNRRVLAGDLLQQSDANAMTFLIARAGSKPAKFNRMHPIYGDMIAGNICSFAELSEHLMRFDEQREGIVVLGLTNAAHQVVAVLAKTEAPRRGRPSSRKQESR